MGIGATDATAKAAPKKKPTQTARRAAAAATPEAPAPKPKRTLYSAERSLTRKATLARARANAMAREMAEVLPRYKVDASGDMVPDVRPRPRSSTTPTPTKSSGRRIPRASARSPASPR